jgi:hypothetical protein
MITYLRMPPPWHAAPARRAPGRDQASSPGGSLAAVEEGTPGFQDEAELPDGGDAACWAHLVFPECGAMLDDPGHPENCGRAARN